QTGQAAATAPSSSGRKYSSLKLNPGVPSTCDSFTSTNPVPLLMHRLGSQSIVYRFRIAALLLCSRCILALACVFLLVYSIYIGNRELTLIGIGLGVLTTLIIIIQWLVSARARCPLCLTPVLANKHCAKHRNARKFLGSHRLRVALAVLLKGSFICPYCHEPTSVEARPKRPAYSRH
ncbi:MAG: hypothetical protein ABI600_16385, partial [Luteolibacter sp.]